MDFDRIEKIIHHLRVSPPVMINSGLHYQLPVTPEDAGTIVDAIEAWWLLNALRANEGATIEIACSNPDFNGQPNEVVEVIDDWTDWKPRKFGGETLLDALRAVFTVRAIMLRETDAHGRSKK